jgi:CRP-like cAMP-binding protein
LPLSADVVVIGAGLTGASAAYHLSEPARQGSRIVVLDQGAPAGEASGRNGGNFELLPENSVGIYEGLARERLAFLHRRYPGVPVEILRIESERQASIIFGFALRNRDLMKRIIEQENIDCDYSPRGWLYLAHTESEEQAICDEVILAAEQRQRIEIWSPHKIRDEFGFYRDHIGRFIPGDGSYHPFKFVCGLFERCLASGVELYTRVKVSEIRTSSEQSHAVVTGEGTIVAGRVIVATNAFTSQIFPELRSIRPAQSQVAITEFAPDRCRGRIVTSEEGPVYFNQPRTGPRSAIAPLLMEEETIASQLTRRRAAGARRYTRNCFVCASGSSPNSRNGLTQRNGSGPAVSLPTNFRPSVFFALESSSRRVSMVTVGVIAVYLGRRQPRWRSAERGPDWLPEDILSPKRLLSETPLFLTGTDSLWRIASSLCVQLQTVNRQISDAISFPSDGNHASKGMLSSGPGVFSSQLADATRTPASSVDPGSLRSLPGFSDFTLKECRELLGMMGRWDLPAGTLLFEQGSPGRSCFVVLSGAVSVSMQVRGQERLLSTLYSGSIFGQIALIEGSLRTATCGASEDAVLLEMEQGACRRLFTTCSPTALKFLKTLNQELIQALRGADRRLMRLMAGERELRSVGEADGDAVHAAWAS